MDKKLGDTPRPSRQNTITDDQNPHSEGPPTAPRSDFDTLNFSKSSDDETVVRSAERGKRASDKKLLASRRK